MPILRCWTERYPLSRASARDLTTPRPQPRDAPLAFSARPIPLRKGLIFFAQERSMEGQT